MTHAASCHRVFWFSNSKLLNHTVTQTNLQIESRTIALNMIVKVEILVETFSAWFDTDLGI